MTNADRAAVDALARHFAWQDGGFYAHLSEREQATYRAKALDVVQVVGPIYQPVTAWVDPTDPRAFSIPDTPRFPRPMSKENDR